MKKIYKAWRYEDDCIIAFAEIDGIKAQIAQGIIPKDAKLLHQVKAST